MGKRQEKEDRESSMENAWDIGTDQEMTGSNDAKYAN